MVLEAKRGVGTEFKIRTLPAQSPDDLARCTVDFVHGAGIARRDEVVAIAVFVNGVDVEVVPGVGGVVARACLAGV